MEWDRAIMKKGIIFSKGKYPIDSWSQRIRMMQKGFQHNNVEFNYIIPFPAPTFESKENSEDFVKFILNPVKRRRNRNLLAVFLKIYGTIKGGIYLIKQKNIDFIILPGLDFLEGIIIIFICKFKHIKFFAEIVDENGKLYSEEKLSAVDHLAKYNQIIYEKLILKRADKIFVISNYLEKKYRKKFPNKEIKRTVPSIIDLNYFYTQQINNILEIKQKGINILLKENPVKIVYAGACNRTNGLKFFLECFADVVQKINIDVKIIFFFVYGNVEKIKGICDSLHILDYVSFFDPVYPKYIPAIYKHSDILLLPEHGYIIANAGFPGKTSEYLASGKAIIATDFSDLSEYLINEENAMISPIDDKKKYGINLLKLIKNKNLREYIGSNAIKTAKEKFNARKAVKVYLK